VRPLPHYRRFAFAVGDKVTQVPPLGDECSDDCFGLAGFCTKCGVGNACCGEVTSPPKKIAAATTIRQKYDAKVFDYSFVNSDWRVHLNPRDGGANQDFYVEEVEEDGASYYKIKIRGVANGAMSVTGGGESCETDDECASGSCGSDGFCADRCLDWGGSRGLYMYPCHDGDNQKWYFDGGSGLGENNAATLRVKGPPELQPEMCLDYNYNDNYNSLYFYSCHKQGNQLFYFFFEEPAPECKRARPRLPPPYLLRAL